MSVVANKRSEIQALYRKMLLEALEMYTAEKEAAECKIRCVQRQIRANDRETENASERLFVS